MVIHSTNWPMQLLYLLLHQLHSCQEEPGNRPGQHYCLGSSRLHHKRAFSCAEALLLLLLLLIVLQVVSVAQVEQATSPELELPAGYHW